MTLSLGEAVSKTVQVHHIKPLATIGQAYEVDPINDLRPVCANCHAVIHHTTQMRTIEEVRAMIVRAGQGYSLLRLAHPVCGPNCRPRHRILHIPLTLISLIAQAGADVRCVLRLKSVLPTLLLVRSWNRRLINRHCKPLSSAPMRINDFQINV